jgi:hypothetical protein
MMGKITTGFQPNLSELEAIANQIGNEDSEQLIIPDSVYDNLPLSMGSLCEFFEKGHDRDVFLTAMLCGDSGILSNVVFQNSSDFHYINLFALITAPAGNGKGSAKWVEKLYRDIDDRILAESEEEVLEWHRANLVAQTDGKAVKSAIAPTRKTLYLAVDTSARAFIDRLRANDGAGIIFDTETATMLNAAKQDWGNTIQTYLKGFENETITIDRKGCDPIRITNPRFSAFISGTPEATKRLINSPENGLFSRFIHYYFNAPAIWKAHQPTEQSMRRDSAFQDAAKKRNELHKKLCSSQIPLFVNILSEQWEEIDCTFRNKLTVLFSQGANPLLSATVKRSAVICEKICCILAVLRHFESGTLEMTISPSTKDVTCAIQLTHTYFAHALRVASSESGILKVTSDSGISGESLLLWEVLPDDIFGVPEIEIAAPELKGKDRTRQRRMKELIEAGLVERVDKTHFKKLDADSRQRRQPTTEPVITEKENRVILEDQIEPENTKLVFS